MYGFEANWVTFDSADGSAVMVDVPRPVWERAKAVSLLLSQDTGMPVSYLIPLYLEWRGVLACADGLCYTGGN